MKYALLLILATWLSFAQATLYSPVGSDGTPGTPTSCGTSPSVSGTDMAGTITVGTGVVTACTLPFSSTLAVAPKCQVTSNSLTVTASITSISTSSLVIGLSATLPGGLITYFCPIK